MEGSNSPYQSKEAVQYLPEQHSSSKISKDALSNDYLNIGGVRNMHNKSAGLVSKHHRSRKLRMKNSGDPSNINSILEKDTQFKIEESNNEIDDFDSIVGPSKFHKTSQESRNTGV